MDSIRLRPTKFVGQGASITSVISRNFQHHTGDGTFLHCSTPILKESTLEDGTASHFSSLPQISLEDLPLDEYFQSPKPHRHCMFANIKPSPGFEPTLLPRLWIFVIELYFS
ncbi:hypothetical protein TNCV_57011 [Trichonephila clavipes]|nr:hypothetical protein TNCV_57011 [Trichonephila clavipes]